MYLSTQCIWGHPLGCGSPTRGHTLQQCWLSLPLKSPTVNIASGRAEDPSAPFASAMECWLACYSWGLAHTTTAPVSWSVGVPLGSVSVMVLDHSLERAHSFASFVAEQALQTHLFSDLSPTASALTAIRCTKKCLRGGIRTGPWLMRRRFGGNCNTVLILSTDILAVHCSFQLIWPGECGCYVT